VRRFDSHPITTRHVSRVGETENSHRARPHSGRPRNSQKTIGPSNPLLFIKNQTISPKIGEIGKDHLSPNMLTQVLDFLQVQNIGFGRNIDRKGAPHCTPHDLHGLGRSSLLTFAREGLVGGIPRGPSTGPTETKELGEDSSRGYTAKAEKGIRKKTTQAQAIWQKPWHEARRLRQGQTLPWGYSGKGCGAKAFPRKARVSPRVESHWGRPSGPSRHPEVSPTIGPSYLAH
jgi:hypothetical protein